MNPPAPQLADNALDWTRAFHEQWLEDRMDPELAPQAAWNWLASWGEVCRYFAPDTLPADLQPLRDTLRNDSLILLKALEAEPFDTDNWIQEADNLDQCWEQPHAADEGELVSAATALFHRLDRESLALCIANTLSPKSGCTLKNRWTNLQRAEDFFEDHALAFLSEASVARQVLINCRPDLDEADFPLWLTLNKHGLLVELEEELHAAENGPLDPRDCAIITNLARDKPPPIIAITRASKSCTAFSRHLLPTELVAAAEVAQASTWIHLRWRSPNQDLEARLLLPRGEGFPQSKPIRLSCVRADDGNLAAQLAGSPIVFAGVVRTLDAEAQADFDLAELRRAGQDLYLEIAGEPWQAIE